MRVGVHGRRMSPDMAPVAAGLLKKMEAHGMVPVLQQDLATMLGNAGQAHDRPVFDASSPQARGMELFIIMGGDGSFLDAVAMVGDLGIPMVGINLGRLGYLSTVRLEETDAALGALVARRFRIQERSLVQIDGCGDGFGGRNFALNEVSVHKRDSSTMLSVQAHLGDRYLNTYWADGLIIATPTGSTAYSLSCGGPLLDPTSNVFVLTPIAAHNLNVRPFVVPDHHEVRLVANPRGDKYLVNLDSRNVTLEASSELHIRKAPFALKLVLPEGYDHLDTLRSKLAWGLDLRSGPRPG